jgi:hypothetical protein
MTDLNTYGYCLRCGIRMTLAKRTRPVCNDCIRSAPRHSAHLLGVDPKGLRPVNEPTTKTPEEQEAARERRRAASRDADGIALLPGWERSRGANLERHVALALELPVETIDTWLARRHDAA